MPRITLRSFMLAGTALSTPFLATPLVAEESEPLLLDEIRIESAEAQTLLGNDQITAQEIEARNPSSTKDVFVGESSITTGGGAAIAQKVYVNGIEESLLSVTIDGARQNKSAFHHTGNVLLDPELLEAVEISKGLAPADAGPGALAGSIAYETKDAGDLLEDGDNFSGRIKLGTSDNGADIESALALFGRQGGFEYLLNVTRRDGDDYEDGDGNTVLGTGADLTDIIGKIAYETQTGHRFEFAASQTEDTGLRAAQAGPGGILFIRPDFGGLTTGPSVLTPGLSRRTSYTLTYSLAQAQGQWDPVIQLSHNEQEIDASAVYGTNTSFSGTIKNRFTIAGGSVTAGLDFFNENAEGAGRGPGPFGSSGQEKLRNIGIFAQARQDLGTRVSVSYGARYDSQKFTGADNSKFSEDGFSANGSVDFVLSDNWSLNAGLASSWGGYELGEAALVNFFTPWNYDGFTTSRAKSGRIGLRFDNGSWTASAAIFRTEVDDINAVLPSGGARGATVDLQSEGIEASLGYNWGNAFARLNWTYADVTMDGDAIGSTAYYLGRPMGQIIALEGGWELDDQWRFGGNAEIARKYSDAAVPLPGYSVVNVYAAYTPRNLDNLEVRLDVRNLFDETYTSRSADGTDFARAIPLNEPGRTIGLTARLKF